MTDIRYDEVREWHHEIQYERRTIDEFMAYFYAQLDEAKAEIAFRQETMEEAAKKVPAVMQHRYDQCMEIEAVLQMCNDDLARLTAKELQAFGKKFNREMTTRDQKLWIEGESEIVAQRRLINRVALLRNKFQGISKGVDSKHFQIGNITKMRAAGFAEDEMAVF